MDKKHVSSSASQLKAPVGWGAGMVLPQVVVELGPIKQGLKLGHRPILSLKL
ncbi:hypothetical protein HAX54_013312 [Datura stramonium]|uniref:Uncharacterized protein n=1 Tax=Datura stramonium TaxID=4076 RepID=A0ABS8TNU9_DATST|nr:hypothetical protein [Datura stramonium]